VKDKFNVELEWEIRVLGSAIRQFL
jgi:UDP-N-acetylenolpyruvoylglucosamine reductase